MTCDICGGRGWLRARAVPAVECHFCGGRGELSWGRVAKMLDEDPDTLARVRHGRSKPETAQRVFNKICKMLWPKGQQEMFT